VAITGLSLDATVLSYAPGGFAEMSLIGLALGIEIAMVATAPSLPPVPDPDDQPAGLQAVAAPRGP
jgi:hypothetical protein